MPRRTRIHLPASYHHVILRGNDREQIFFSDEDRYRLFMLLQEGCERFEHRIHAFCLMNNHIHLLIQVADIPLSKIIQNVSFRYAQYIHKKLHRIGHLFQGRFKSILLDSENYLTTLVRYIHLNPVKAKLVTNPLEYPWSSHRAYLGRENIHWLTTQTVLERFGDNRLSSIQNFEQFVLSDQDEDENDNIFEKGSYKGTLLDEKAFLSAILRKPKIIPKKEVSLDYIIKQVCRHFDLSLEELISPLRSRKHLTARGIIALLTQETPKLTLNELALFLKRDSSTLSRLALSTKQKTKNDSELANSLIHLRSTTLNT